MATAGGVIVLATWSGAEPSRGATAPPGELPRFSQGFERPDAATWGISVDDGHVLPSTWPTRGPVRRVSGASREGRHKIRFAVNPRPRSFRAEITRKTVPVGSDCWYGFSINVPKRWQRDHKGTILAQWHALVPRKVDNYPVLALYLIDDTWQVRMNWNVSGDTSQGPGWHQKKFPLGAARKGGWTDWVVHARWSHRSDGLLQVWQDGKRLVDYRGPNEYVDPTGPYFKMGIYHPAWRHGDATIPPHTIPLVSYADAIRFARNGSYAAVKPR
jgi:hypothetical protein